MLAIIAIVQTDDTPALNMTITFLTALSPFTAISILSENKAQTMAAIINDIDIDNIESFPISPSTASGLLSRS